MKAFTHPTFSVYNNSTRMSIAYNDIGAKWGRSYAKKLRFDYIGSVNLWARAYFLKAKDLEYDKDKKDEYFEKLVDTNFRLLEWHKVIAPDAQFLNLW